jgi:DNA polymerase-3 subunit epsilon
MEEAEREMLTDLLLPHLPVGTMMTVFGFAIGVLVLQQAVQAVCRGLLRMAETLRMMLGANRNFRVDAGRPAGSAATGARRQRSGAAARCLMDDVDEQIAAAKASVEEEKNRLAALMSELAQAVVVCNLDGRILLYNNRARLQFKAWRRGRPRSPGGALIGLRALDFLHPRKEPGPARQEVIRQRLAAGKTALSNFITTTARRPAAARPDGSCPGSGRGRARRCPATC